MLQKYMKGERGLTWKSCSRSEATAIKNKTKHVATVLPMWLEASLKHFQVHLSLDFLNGKQILLLWARHTSAKHLPIWLRTARWSKLTNSEIYLGFMHTSIHVTPRQDAHFRIQQRTLIPWILLDQILTFQIWTQYQNPPHSKRDLYYSLHQCLTGW